MTTPRKKRIIERAKEIWLNEQWKNGTKSGINPTEQELKESGCISQAIGELMRAEGYEYRMYVEQAQRKSYLKPNIFEGKYPIDLKECEKSNILVSGTNQQGKSLCAMGLCDVLMRNGWQIISFDNVGHWKHKSSIAKTFTVKENSHEFVMSIGESVIFDIALLKASQQKKFVEQILEQTWIFRVLTKPQKWLALVFEEFQLYGKNVRGNVSENILRIMSVGANYKIRCLGITPDLSLIDCAFIRLCQQRYHFRLGNEPNAKRRFRAYYSKDWCQIARNLDVGFCIYVNKEKLEVWKIPLFEKQQIKVKT